jgi:hypothetical protein
MAKENLHLSKNTKKHLISKPSKAITKKLLKAFSRQVIDVLTMYEMVNRASID